jgi:CRP/FNR family transcriptional regulator, cyclic AMP receptor protein
MKARTFPVGTPIFVENMVADSLFLIQQGQVALSMKSSDGKDNPLVVLEAGQTFGELSLLIGGKRMVSATARTQCNLLELHRQEVSKLFSQKAQVGLKLMMVIVNQFGKRLAGCRPHLKTLILSQLIEYNFAEGSS